MKMIELLEQATVKEFLHDLETISALLPPHRKVELLEGFKRVLAYAYCEGEDFAHRSQKLGG
ncbi:hypothetical protein LCGC14_2136180 [marine sediment metagenome]|uniref:Uncharacterized protein n=1 Tax=marine sediment metagenome TaxID=412755 RepID=A0A0F9EM54_9ZZZZ